MNARLAILIADGQRNQAGQAFAAKGVEFKDATNAFVMLEDDGTNSLATIVGRATLSMHENVVYADCELMEHRLLASQLAILYPHPLGYILESDGSDIKRVLIKNVNLSVSRPSDPRITSLSQQGVKPRRRG